MTKRSIYLKKIVKNFFLFKTYRFYDERLNRHISQCLIFTLNGDETTEAIYQYIRRLIVTICIMMRQELGETEFVDPICDHEHMFVVVVKIFVPVDLRRHTNN